MYVDSETSDERRMKGKSQGVLWSPEILRGGAVSPRRLRTAASVTQKLTRLVTAMPNIAAGSKGRTSNKSRVFLSKPSIFEFDDVVVARSDDVESMRRRREGGIEGLVKVDRRGCGLQEGSAVLLSTIVALFDEKVAS